MRRSTDFKLVFNDFYSVFFYYYIYVQVSVCVHAHQCQCLSKPEAQGSPGVGAETSSSVRTVYALND